MRSSALLTAALAAGAVASPLFGHLVERAVVTDITYVTTTIVITAGEGAPTPAPKQNNREGKGWQGFKWSWSWNKPAAPVPTDTYTPPSEAPAPAAPVPAPDVPAPTPEPAAPEPAPPAPAAPEPAPASPAPVQSSGSGACGLADKYAQMVVDHHNAHRFNHSAPAIQWSQPLADIARQTAETCVYKHDVVTGGGGYGQNIAAGVPPSKISEVITNLFYNAEEPNYAPYYGSKNPNLDENAFDGVGHFTQIVWKATTEVGCYTADCTQKGLSGQGVSGNVGKYFTVCNYKSPGNFQNEYAQNVGASLGHPSIDGSYGDSNCPSLKYGAVPAAK